MQRHLNGYFNVYHVPTAIAIVTKDGGNILLCEEHYEAGGAFDKL